MLGDFGGAGLGRPEVKGRLVFLDTETTGLGTGPGVRVFLVGLAWREGDELVVEQRMLLDFEPEAELLAWVRETLAARADALVTYNGASFDLPLLETRRIMQRVEPVLPGGPHLDLLHRARALWRGTLSSCSLVSLERAVLGFERPDDLPGGAQPAAWLDMVRSGNRALLPSILDHNADDLVSLAALTGLVGHAYAGGAVGGPRVQTNLGRSQLRLGRLDAAHRAFSRAEKRGATGRELWEPWTTVLRRLDRREDEARILRLWIEGEFDVEPHERLARLLEHREKDRAGALEVCRAALARLRFTGALRAASSAAPWSGLGDSPEVGRVSGEEARLRRRMARLESGPRRRRPTPHAARSRDQLPPVRNHGDSIACS